MGVGWSLLEKGGGVQEVWCVLSRHLSKRRGHSPATTRRKERDRSHAFLLPPSVPLMKRAEGGANVARPFL